MTLLLCPECCQWREPAEGRCPVCAGALDAAIPDPSLDAIANELGELQGLLGVADLSRTALPKRGCLYATTNGLLFVPNDSRVIAFEDTHHAEVSASQRWLGQLVSRLSSRLNARGRTARFACERRPSERSEERRVGKECRL